MTDFTIGSVKYEQSAGRLACERCGHQLCEWGANYKDFATVRTLTAEQVRDRISSSFYIKEHDGIEFREFICPGCGRVLDFETYEVGEPARLDYESLAGAREKGYDARAMADESPDSWVRFA
jgi:acetone carboxylase gamma subunit